VPTSQSQSQSPDLSLWEVPAAPAPGIAFSIGKTTPFVAVNSGLLYWPLEPDVELITIEDIAHSLAFQCRYNGHVERFYSVAEHSLILCELASLENKFAALMHDSTEAYCCDIPRPLKSVWPEYKAIEHRIWLRIAEKFGLPGELPAEVQHLDGAICNDEMRELIPRYRYPTGVEKYGSVWTRGFECLAPREAEARFLSKFHELHRAAA